MRLIIVLFSLVAPVQAMATPEQIDIQWQGDFSATAQFLGHARGYSGDMGVGIQEAIVHTKLVTENYKPLSASFGLGVLEKFNYETVLSPFAPIDVGLHYGWLELASSYGLRWQVGQLARITLFENAFSTRNAHIQHASINYSHSWFYPGIRAGITWGMFDSYIEMTGPDNPNASATVLGTRLNYGNGEMLFSAELSESRNAFHASWKQMIHFVKLGMIVEYSQLKDDLAWRDDNALAVAGLFEISLERNIFSFRGELFDAGNSGVYTFETAGVITATYTFKTSQQTYLRLEAVYAKSSNKIFREEGVWVADQYGTAFQMGLTF